MCVFFGVLIYSINHPSLPSDKERLLFYSNQTGDDLKRVYRSAIQSAKESLFLQIYGFTDPDLIGAFLKKRSDKMVFSIFYDPSGSGSLYKKIREAIPVKGLGLMHKKILVIDHLDIFLGTANLTPTSLCMHDNVVVGLRHAELAHFLEYSNDNHYCFCIDNQQGTLWHLPDFQDQCLSDLLNTLEQAKESIYLSLFTFTHPKIVKALIKAKNRGVKICIAIDSYAARGASKNSITKLENAGIIPRISQGRNKLLHHKWALIDQSTLLIGSANWTVSAFQKNDDCLLKLYPLTVKQNLYFMKIWKHIQSGSILSTEM